jgi:hypothetical protein
MESISGLDFKTPFLIIFTIYLDTYMDINKIYMFCERRKSGGSIFRKRNCRFVCVGSYKFTGKYVKQLFLSDEEDVRKEEKNLML